jgi:deazaflavin-dependent oxidoreductase (nitroreductase family)
MNDTYQQKDVSFLTYPTAPWHQALFKWPVHLWRLGMAPVIGKLMMLITHTGRISGLPRRTMVEYFTMDGKKYVASGFGNQAQWYRNIETDPHVTIQTAGGVERVKATRVTDGETMLRLLDLVKYRDGPLLNVYLQTVDVQPNKEDILAKLDRFYWLTFEPTAGSGRWQRLDCLPCFCWERNARDNFWYTDSHGKNG